MTPFFRGFLAPPILATEADTENARVLHRVLLTTLAVGTFFLLLLILEMPASAARRARTIGVLVIMVVTLLHLNRRGNTLLASCLAISGLVGLISLRALTAGGISAPATSAFVIIVLLAGLLLGPRGGIVTALVCAVIGMGLVVLESRGELPPSELRFTPLATWLYNCMWLSLAIVLQQQVAGTLSAALRRAKAELQQRKQTEQRLRLALDAGKIGVWSLELAGNRFIVDPRLLDLYGIAPAADGTVDYATWASRVHPEDRPQAEAALRRLRDGDKHATAQFRIVRPDGDMRTIEGAATIVTDEAGRPLQVVGVNVDVTDRRQAEEERGRLLHDLTERVKELKLLHTTAHLLRHDRPADTALFRELVNMLPPAWQFPESCQARIRFRDIDVATPGWRETEWRQSTRFTTSEGTGTIDVVYLDDHTPPTGDAFLREEQMLLDSLAEMLVVHVELRKHQEGLEGLVATRTRELSLAKQEADRANAAKSAFLANMSHEIRTPMNAVLGYAQLLKRDSSLAEEQRHKIDVILASGDHLLTVINNVLEMSKIEAGHTTLTPELFDLHALLDDARLMFVGLAATKGNTLVLEPANDLPRTVHGDPAKIRQVVINLLSNAMKFTKQGRISVKVSSEKLPQQEHRIAVSVEDTGAGIEVDQMNRIFEPFEQSSSGAREGGTGLGLSISRNFARLMGGELTARSRLGAGSVFTFTFQVGGSPSSDSRGVDKRRTPIGIADDARSRRKILVVDDEANNRALFGELFATVGFDAQVAASGEKAIEIHHAWRPDLILMDLRMPGIGGREAIRRLKADGSTAVMVVLTASGLGEATQEILSEGAVAVLLKPYRESDLLQKIGEWLNLRYIYADEATPAPAPAAGMEGAAETGSLADLLSTTPDELIKQLLDAVGKAQAGRIDTLADQIAGHSPAAAQMIRTLAGNFRYDSLAAALARRSAVRTVTA